MTSTHFLVFALSALLVALLSVKTVFFHGWILRRIQTSKVETAVDFRKRYVLWQLLGTSILLLICKIRPEHMVFLLCIEAMYQYVEFNRTMLRKDYSFSLISFSLFSVLAAAVFQCVFTAQGIKLPLF